MANFDGDDPVLLVPMNLREAEDDIGDEIQDQNQSLKSGRQNSHVHSR